MVMLTVLTLWGLSLFIGQFSAAQHRIRSAQNTAQALAEAKEALIGDAISRSVISKAAYLRLPDLGQDFIGNASEGTASGNFAGSGKDYSVIGKLPWKTLRTAALRDGNAECIWYIVSGRYIITPPTDSLNWDTQGQIDVIDGNGNTIATNLAALLVAPGAPLAGQDRALSNAAYTECGGNYDARNYLDTYSTDDAISGEVNYFAGSINSRVAQNTNDKRFVITSSKHYNDSFLHITTEDVFLPLIRRDGFKAAIEDLFGNPTFVSHLQTVVIAGAKGIDNIKCRCNNSTCADAVVFDPPPDQEHQELFYEFCKNWKEMLFLKQLQTPGVITVDGAVSPVICSRVLFFSGRKAIGQSRNTAAEKADVNNYLEGTNATSFNTVSAPASDFSGASTFNWSTPETDLIRCLP